MKRTVCIILLAATLLSFAAFSGCSKDKGGFKDDVKVEDLASKLEKTFEAEGLTAVDEGYIKGMMKLEPDDLGEYIVKLNVYGTNIDEYGILKGADEKETKELKKAMEDYLKMRDESWMPEYMPEEYPKLKNADCKSFGNYVIYAILGDEAKDALFAEAEAQLKK